MWTRIVKGPGIAMRLRFSAFARLVVTSDRTGRAP